MTVAYILDPHYLEESKKKESICLTTFANFSSTKYSNNEASKMYAELLKFRNRQAPYNNQIISNSAIHVNSTTWWTFWPLNNNENIDELEDYRSENINAAKNNENENIDAIEDIDNKNELFDFSLNTNMIF
ncbi:17966_t:CDS:2 [Cetraspora pellucida]|uniref:17966_t:CDS:1 n=1 Tax=Cetraspora pellucida TaxID=1433469 RepID=A0ACA9KJ54_9GLOM|nr:17966_t:CDS:2 [Cetraspora pellucida]